MTYEQIERTVLPNNWRKTTYRRADGSEFHTASAPIEVRADYGGGRQFLDHITYDEAAEHEMALRLGTRQTVTLTRIEEP